ncbi:acetyltransferase GNAT domain containing protein [Nitzschia inconspicua]|uniref:Acetyltransferase GNAT domain containing protein n=1 Tax=Nitzschia inconspicua TaxID=303405 RepID=A0A9K3PRK0_9STRA|nr:acetyltransferase GNAT domain containing protein [Nitzschia inconspicua]
MVQARFLAHVWSFWMLRQAIFSYVTPIEALSPSSISSSQFTYRMAKNADLPAVAQLLRDTFESDDQNKDSTKAKEIEQGLQCRMTEMKSTSLPHAFLVATPSDLVGVKAPDAIAAFLELGTMPSPISIEKEWNGVKVSTRPELPYVANLVVAESTRRQKVGYTMVQLAIKIAKKWCDGSSDAFLFLSVDHDNQGALSFYERLGFERIDLSTSQKALPTKSKVYLKKFLFR